MKTSSQTLATSAPLLTGDTRIKSGYDDYGKARRGGFVKFAHEALDEAEHDGFGKPGNARPDKPMVTLP